MFFTRKKYPVVLFALLLGIRISAQVEPGYEAGLKYIDQSNLKKHISFLSDDSLKGRGEGSKENLIAAMYVANKFRAAGLKPLKSTEFVKPAKESEYNKPLKTEDENLYSGYLQKFSIQNVELSADQGFQLMKSSGGSEVILTYKYNQDFFIEYAGSDDISVKAPLVFCGFGVNSPELRYNDFADKNGNELDLKNKIAVIVDSYPEWIGNKMGRIPIEFRTIKKKVEYAEKKGALAVIVVRSPLVNDDPVDEKYKKAFVLFSRDHYRLQDQLRNDIPVYYLTDKVANEIFTKQYGKKLSVILGEMTSSKRPYAFEMDMSASLSIKTKSTSIPMQNVAGFLEGTDPQLKNEAIIICAHYDHLGYGYYGALDKSRIGQIHNGADDNASGVAGILELVRAFSANRPKRSVVFLSFSGEEVGMLGSKYYVDYQPLFPVEKTVACLNLDMIGRNGSNFIWLVGAFQGRDIINTVKSANEKVGMDLFYNVGMLSMASDQAYFLRKKIPSVFFYDNEDTDYHTPSDKISKIDFDKVERVSRLAYISGWTLANQKSRPQYLDLTQQEKEELVKESIVRFKKLNSENN